MAELERSAGVEVAPEPGKGSWDLAGMAKLSQSFVAGKVIAAMAPTFQAIAHELVDGFAARGRVELVRVLALLGREHALDRLRRALRVEQQAVGGERARGERGGHARATRGPQENRDAARRP